jgi:hypothetical protein
MVTERKVIPLDNGDRKMPEKANVIPRLPKWMLVAVWLVTILGGLSALGLSLNFDLESKSHAATTYATKDEVREMSSTLREVRDNVIRLMERQGIPPVRRRGGTR